MLYCYSEARIRNEYEEWVADDHSPRREQMTIEHITEQQSMSNA